VSFDWNGQGRKVILMKSGGYVFKHHSRFDDSDNYTHLDLEYNEKTNTFLAYCNAVSSKNNAIERAKRRMSDVYLKKIKI
jgi:ribosomal protein S8